MRKHLRRFYQFQHRDASQFNSVVLGLAHGIWRTKIPLLANDFSKRTSTVGRPSQEEFLRTRVLSVFEDEPDRLSPFGGSTPATLSFLHQGMFDRAVFFVRSYLNHCDAV